MFKVVFVAVTLICTLSTLADATQIRQRLPEQLAAVVTALTSVAEFVFSPALTTLRSIGLPLPNWVAGYALIGLITALPYMVLLYRGFWRLFEARKLVFAASLKKDETFHERRWNLLAPVGVIAATALSLLIAVPLWPSIVLSFAWAFFSNTHRAGEDAIFSDDKTPEKVAGLYFAALMGITFAVVVFYGYALAA
ncbi:MAG: hypothetical protein ACOH2L_16800 [Devosia sp.]